MRLALPLILLLVTASCNRGDSEGPPIPSAGTLTLGDDGCTYEGPGKISSGALSVSVVNGSEDSATFELWKINEGGTFEDFQTHVSTQPAGGAFAPPPSAQMVSSASVGKSENGAFAATVDAGTYGFVCSRLDASDDLVAVFAAGPLEVNTVEASFALILLGIVAGIGILAALLIFRRKAPAKAPRRKIRVPEIPLPAPQSGEGEGKYGF